MEMGKGFNMLAAEKEKVKENSCRNVVTTKTFFTTYNLDRKVLVYDKSCGIYCFRNVKVSRNQRDAFMNINNVFVKGQKMQFLNS